MKKNCFAGLLLLLNATITFSQDYMTSDQISIKIEKSENIRNEIIQLLPTRQPWETDEEFYLNVAATVYDNNVSYNIVKEFILENYYKSLLVYNIDSSKAKISPYGFERDKKRWRFDITALSPILPNSFRLYYNLIIEEDNIADKYRYVVEKIESNQFNLSVDIYIMHNSCYELCNFLGFIGLDIINSLDGNIITLFESIIENPGKYCEKGDEEWCTIRAKHFKDIMINLKFYKDEYIIVIKNIYLFDDKVELFGFPDEGAALFYASNVKDIKPIKSGR